MLFNAKLADDNSLVVGNLRVPIEGSVTNENLRWTKFYIKMKKLIVDNDEPRRRFFAINYLVPEGCKIVKIIPGMFIYAFHLDEENRSFSIIGREAPELFSSRVYPLILIYTDADNKHHKVSFINKTDDRGRPFTIDVRELKPAESEKLKESKYLHIFSGTRFINKYKFNDNMVIVYSEKYDKKSLVSYFGNTPIPETVSAITIDSETLAGSTDRKSVV